MAGEDRRGFLRRLARDTARAAFELDSAMRFAADGDEPGEAAEPLLVDRDVAPAPVEPAARTATPDELRGLCRELGIQACADAAVRAARASIRLTPTTRPVRTRLGGRPPAGLERPTWQGVPLDPVLQVALDELPPSALPPAGTLLVFFALAAAPDGTHPEHEGSCRVVHLDAAAVPEPDPARSALALEPSVELTLPFDVPPDAEDACGFEEWLELRTRLAAAQGVELEETLAASRAAHRLLGHPDSLAEPEPDAPDGSARWTLLAQVSGEPAAGIVLPPDERLFVRIDERDLAAGRFDAVRAFVL